MIAGTSFLFSLGLLASLVSNKPLPTPDQFLIRITLQFTSIDAARHPLPTPARRVPPASSQPTQCTTFIPKNPPLQVDCTFAQKTRTVTESLDCGGCVLETLFLGVGLVSSFRLHSLSDLSSTNTQISHVKLLQPFLALQLLLPKSAPHPLPPYKIELSLEPSRRICI